MIEKAFKSTYVQLLACAWFHSPSEQKHVPLLGISPVSVVRIHQCCVLPLVSCLLGEQCLLQPENYSQNGKLGQCQSVVCHGGG